MMRAPTSESKMNHSFTPVLYFTSLLRVTPAFTTTFAATNTHSFYYNLYYNLCYFSDDGRACPSPEWSTPNYLLVLFASHFTTTNTLYCTHYYTLYYLSDAGRPGSSPRMV
jgi:hypothetical protein